MTELEQRIVVEGPFDRALAAVVHAVRDEGLEVLATLDVREHFRRTLGLEFRQYARLEVWSADLAFLALKRDLLAGTVMPTTLAVYELASGETAVVAHQASLSTAAEAGCPCEEDSLRPIAAQERDRITRVLARLRHLPRRPRILPRAA